MAQHPSDPLKSYWGFFPPAAHHGDPFKSLHNFPSRPDLLEREHLFQRYSFLDSSGGGAPLTEKVLLDKEVRDKEHSLEKHKLIHPSLRPGPGPGTSPPTA